MSVSDVDAGVLFPVQDQSVYGKGTAIMAPFTMHLPGLCLSFVKLFHSLDRRLHQLFQDLLVYSVQSFDIQTSRAGCELAKFF